MKLIFLTISIILAINSFIISIIEQLYYNIQFTDSLAVLFILLDSLVIITIIFSQKKIKSFNLIIASSYIIRVCFLFWDRYCREIFTFPNSGLDTGSFDMWAKEFISNGMSGFTGYPVILGYIYKLFYPNPLWGQYLNILASLLTTMLVFKIISKVDIQKKYKMLIIILISYLPNYLILSAILLRESFIALLLTIAVYGIIIWWYDNEKKGIVIALISTMIATYLHSGAIAYLIAIAIILAFAGNNKREFKFKIRTVLILFTGFTLFFALYANFGDIFFAYMGGIESTEDIIAKSETYSSGGSAYSVSVVDDNSLFGLIVNSPIKIFYFLTSPLPWDWRGLNDVAAFLFSSLLYSISTFTAIRAVRFNTKNKNLIIVLIILAFSSVFVYSWGVSNAGTALRHRDKFITNFIIMLAVSMDAIKNRKKEIGKID